MILPKYLKKKPQNPHDKWHIYMYSGKLAQRPDMFPLWPDGVDPNVKPSGLNVEDARNDQLHAELVEKDQEIIAKDQRIIALEAEVDRLESELHKSYGLEEPVKADPERQAIVNAAVAEMFSESNQEDFTTTGIPRVEKIEARCGFDVTGAERDEAIKAYKK